MYDESMSVTYVYICCGCMLFRASSLHVIQERYSNVLQIPSKVQNCDYFPLLMNKEKFLPFMAV